MRITHLPTGLVVSCQDEKSQIKNRAKAERVLRSRLYELELEKQQAALGAERTSMVGTGDRSEKIRTYNFPQNRVTDHRIGLTLHQLDFVMEGKMDAIFDALDRPLPGRENEAAGGTGTGQLTAGMTVQTALQQGTRILEDAGIAVPRLTAEVLLGHAMRVRARLLLRPPRTGIARSGMAALRPLPARAARRQTHPIHHAAPGILRPRFPRDAGRPDPAAGDRARRRGRPRRRRAARGASSISAPVPARSPSRCAWNWLRRPGPPTSRPPPLQVAAGNAARLGARCTISWPAI